MNSYEGFPMIETERLKLRPIEESDTEEIFATFSDEDSMKYYGMDPFTTKDQATTIIQAFAEGFKTGSSIRWGISLSETNQLIGTCGFHNWSKSDHRTEIGYELNREYRGNGYMNEALKAVIHYAFNGMAFNRISATIRPENDPSQNLVRKLGFQNEALLKEYQHTDGKYYDMYLFTLLKRNASLY
jgi:[ribosomal protein S5]-alanine N-acetyltransferase